MERYILIQSFYIIKSYFYYILFVAECAQLQLEFLKLYTPECLEILESLRQITDTNINLDKS